jgi:hypothetical protein
MYDFSSQKDKTMRTLRATKKRLQEWSIGGLALLVTLFTLVAGIADDGKQQEPVPTVGGECYVTLKSVLSNGERLIELARGDSKQTSYRFVLKIDTEQVEITPGPKDQIKIVHAGLEMLTNQVMFRTNLEKLQITATLALDDQRNKVESPMVLRTSAKDLGVRLTVPAFDFKVGVSEGSSSAAPIRLTIPSVQEAPVVWDWNQPQGKVNDEGPLKFNISLVR